MSRLYVNLTYTYIHLHNSAALSVERRLTQSRLENHFWQRSRQHCTVCHSSLCSLKLVFGHTERAASRCTVSYQRTETNDDVAVRTPGILMNSWYHYGYSVPSCASRPLPSTGASHTACSRILTVVSSVKIVRHAVIRLSSRPVEQLPRYHITVPLPGAYFTTIGNHTLGNPSLSIASWMNTAVVDTRCLCTYKMLRGSPMNRACLMQRPPRCTPMSSSRQIYF